MCLLYAAQWVLYVFIWLYATERHQKNYDSTLIYALLRLLFDLGFVASGALGPLLGSSGIPITICCFGIATVFVLTILLPLDTEIDIRHQQSANCAGRSDDHGANVFGRPERLASRYSLSPRESEILTYLLNGYSLAAIRNELYIAKGTVDTYVQRIYRKCGVHSRQELVDLADEKGR